MTCSAFLPQLAPLVELLANSSLDGTRGRHVLRTLLHRRKNLTGDHLLRYRPPHAPCLYMVTWFKVRGGAMLCVIEQRTLPLPRRVVPGWGGWRATWTRPTWGPSSRGPCSSPGPLASGSSWPAACRRATSAPPAG